MSAIEIPQRSSGLPYRDVLPLFGGFTTFRGGAAWMTNGGAREPDRMRRIGVKRAAK
jgi:hypothetical protein